MSSSNAAGSGCSSIQSRTFAPTRASSATSVTSSASTVDRIRSYSPSAARNSRYASAVVAKPPGTLTPASDRFDTISPSEAFLPPT